MPYVDNLPAMYSMSRRHCSQRHSRNLSVINVEIMCEKVHVTFETPADYPARLSRIVRVQTSARIGSPGQTSM